MLTPIEIQGKTFKTGRGYKKEDIDEFLITVGRDYETLYKENLEYKDKLNTLSEGLAYYKSIENTLQKALVLAEKTSNDTTSNAEKKAEAIEEKARLKAENIEAEAKAEAEKILSESKKELSKLEMKIVSMAQEYEKYRAQFRQMAKAQIEILDGAAYQIDFKAQDINTEPIHKEKEGGISLFLNETKRAKEHKAEPASDSDGEKSETPVNPEPAQNDVSEKEQVSEKEYVPQKEPVSEKEYVSPKEPISEKESDEPEGETLNEIFERLKSKNNAGETGVSDKDGVTGDTTDVWTPDLQKASSADFTFFQTENTKNDRDKKENPAMGQTTDFEFIKEEDS